MNMLLRTIRDRANDGMVLTVELLEWGFVAKIRYSYLAEKYDEDSIWDVPLHSQSTRGQLVCMCKDEINKQAWEFNKETGKFIPKIKEIYTTSKRNLPLEKPHATSWKGDYEVPILLEPLSYANGIYYTIDVKDLSKIPPQSIKFFDIDNPHLSYSYFHPRNSKFNYLIKDASGLTKIGMTSNPEQRMRSVKSHNPSAKMIWHGVGDREREWHNKYKDKNVSGEWFNLSKHDIEFIKVSHNTLEDL